MEDEEMRMVSLPKKVWNVVRVFLYMLKRGICKKKLLLDLNLLLKRGKLAGKAALVNLTLFHHSATASFFATRGPPPPGEFEFSCSNTPAHHNFLLSHVIPALRHYKAAYVAEEEVAALHMMVASGPVEASPLLPGLGFGRSPLVRQLRVTDSPYPMSSSEGGDCHVDEAADEFIKRFYSQLRTQSITDY